MITATSMDHPSRSDTVSIAITAVQTANFVFSLNGEENNDSGDFYSLAGVVAIAQDGSGNVLSGEQDYNDGDGNTSPQPTGDSITTQPTQWSASQLNSQSIGFLALHAKWRITRCACCEADRAALPPSLVICAPVTLGPRLCFGPSRDLMPRIAARVLARRSIARDHGAPQDGASAHRHHRHERTLP